MVRDAETGVLDRLRHTCYVLRLREVKQINSIMLELLPHSQRKNYKSFAAVVHEHLPAEFQLLHCFAQTEALKQSPAPTSQCPADSVILMRFKGGAYIFRRYLKTGYRRDFDFRP